MAKDKHTTVRNIFELAEVFGLSSKEAIDIDMRSKLKKKIYDVVKAKRLTHAQVAKRAKTSRTRVTAILNGQSKGISTDLLFRILHSLGYTVNITFSPTKIAA